MRLPILTDLVEIITFPTLNLADFSLQKYINYVVYIIHQKTMNRWWQFEAPISQNIPCKIMEFFSPNLQHYQFVHWA